MIKWFGFSYEGSKYLFKLEALVAVHLRSAKGCFDELYIKLDHDGLTLSADSVHQEERLQQIYQSLRESLGEVEE